MLSTGSQLLGFAGKILLAWILVSALILQVGNSLLLPLLPLFEAVIKSLVSGFLPKLSIVHASGGGVLQLEVWVLSSIPFTAGVVIPKGMVLTASTHVLHVFVPVALLLSMLLVWPLPYQWQRLWLLGFGVLFAVLILLATVPVLLLGVLEMSVQEAAQAANSLYQPPWFMDWMIFCEMGGSLLLAVMAGFLAIWILQRLFPGKN
jgi:hypothetical protein